MEATAPASQGHPRGLYVLFGAEMFERLCYYGMRGLLTLYLTKALLMGDDKAFGIYGAYTALVYAAPVAGGQLADKVIGYRRVRSSSGHVETRPLIRTDLELMGERWSIELTLANRIEMDFRMLLGREALRGRFLVDPGRSFCAGRRPGVTPRRKTN